MTFEERQARFREWKDNLIARADEVGRTEAEEKTESDNIIFALASPLLKRLDEELAAAPPNLANQWEQIIWDNIIEKSFCGSTDTSVNAAAIPHPTEQHRSIWSVDRDGTIKPKKIDEDKEKLS